MSRGHGHTQNGILEALRDVPAGMTASALADAVYGGREPAHMVAVRRALQGLEREGEVSRHERLANRENLWRRAPKDTARPVIRGMLLNAVDWAKQNDERKLLGLLDQCVRELDREGA